MFRAVELVGAALLMASAAGWVSLGIVVLGVILGCFLPEPKGENLD